MSVVFKPVESYRDDFTYRNSPQAIARFPFPFPQDSYMYSVNLEPGGSGAADSVFEHWFDVDEHYLSETAERARVLELDPDRCVVMPHMAQAAWDALELLMTHLSRLSEELILWMSPRVGFIDLADRFCTGSSIMPQKKNPDVPELVRGKTGRVNGSLIALLEELAPRATEEAGVESVEAAGHEACRGVDGQHMRQTAPSHRDNNSVGVLPSRAVDGVDIEGAFVTGEWIDFLVVTGGRQDADLAIA